MRNILRKKWITSLYGSIVIIMLVSACNSSAAHISTMETKDSDGDGWSDSQELQARTDPRNVDSDGDGYWDSKDANPLDPNINIVRNTSSPESTSSPEPEPITVPIQTQEPEPVPITPEENPAPIIQVPTVIGEMGEITQSTELISVDYSWTYNSNNWSWEGEIPLFLYEYYQKIPRPPTKNYSVYVTHPLDDPYIDLLVEKIEKAAEQQHYNEYQTVEFAAAFVQSLPYTVDSVTAPFDEYPRYPIETLVDNGGDCEDTSILLASIIDKMGYGVVLIMLPDHWAVGVKGSDDMYGAYYNYEGSRYYYIETTGEGWGIGELPDEYKNASASIRPLIPTPILTHEGSINVSGYTAEAEIIVHNKGTAPAHNVSVLVGFDAGGDMLWNPGKSEPFTIGVDQKATVKLNLRIPLNKHTRMVAQIGIDNVLVDESYTDWFDT